MEFGFQIRWNRIGNTYSLTISDLLPNKTGMELETMSLTIPYRLPDKQPNSTGNRIGDTSFNYTCKQPNQVGFIPLTIPALTQYR